jgi:Ca2+-binding RTX toxin-like protein
MPNLILGGLGDDILVGGTGDDLIIDPWGHDRINGDLGNDTILAGEGNDVAKGGSGDDNVDGGSGNDLIQGNDGADTLTGNLGDDTVRGGAGVDHINGDQGNDIVYGDDGDDFVFGGQNIDHVYGGAGNDHVFVGEGNDKLYGDAGNDTLISGDGKDYLTGGAGDDTFLFRFHDPKAGSIQGYSNVTDFDPSHDTFAFDAAGLGRDGVGANFVDNGNGTSGGAVTTFFSGAAADAHGESVVVVTDQGFASADAAAKGISGETAGDIIAYYDSATSTANLAYVTSADHADTFVHLTNVHSVADLAALGLTASDFTYV